MSPPAGGPLVRLPGCLDRGRAVVHWPLPRAAEGDALTGVGERDDRHRAVGSRGRFRPHGHSDSLITEGAPAEARLRVGGRRWACALHMPEAAMPTVGER